MSASDDDADDPSDRGGDEPLPDRSAWGPGRAPGTGHLAIAVETFVVEERGRWFVDVAVVFTDEAVRRRVGPYRSPRHAEIAAHWIRRGAERDIEGPLHP